MYRQCICTIIFGLINAVTNTPIYFYKNKNATSIMKRLWLLLTIIIPSWASAQSEMPEEFSYIEDYVFEEMENVYGYTFVPEKGMLANSHRPIPIDKGDAIFDITSTGVTISEKVKFDPTGRQKKAEEIYKLSIPRIDKIPASNGVPYGGFDITLMDYQNPNIQGYIKVYLDEKNRVSSLVFKPSSNEAARAYFIKELDYDTEQRDSRFFTHTEDVNASGIENLIDARIYPFYSLTDMGDYFEYNRLYPKDRVMIQIEERSEMKGKKEKFYNYIIFETAAADGTVSKQEFLIKKVNEQDGRLEFEVRGDGDAKSYIYLHWVGTEEGQTTLRSIEIPGIAEYFMRPGKRRSE